MATTIPNFLTAKVINALDTYNYTIQTTGMHVATIQLTEVPASGISILIKLNGSTVATAPAPSATQSAITLSVTMNCVATDVVSFVLSSSSATDQQLNSIKAILNIHMGSSN